MDRRWLGIVYFLVKKSTFHVVYDNELILEIVSDFTILRKEHVFVFYSYRKYLVLASTNSVILVSASRQNYETLEEIYLILLYKN